MMEHDKVRQLLIDCRADIDEVDTLLQAANEAALENAADIVRNNWADTRNLQREFIPALIRALIPQPSALDRRLAEARLEEAEWWSPRDKRKWSENQTYRIAELRRALPFDSPTPEKVCPRCEGKTFEDLGGDWRMCPDCRGTGLRAQGKGEQK
jgi:rubredoxin